LPNVEFEFAVGISPSVFPSRKRVQTRWMIEMSTGAFKATTDVYI